MVFTSRKTQYTVIATISENEINDCYIARRSNSADGSQYTLILIKDHSTIKIFLEMYRRADISGENPLIESFSVENDYVLVYPYRTERPLKDFYVGDAMSLSECEGVCINLIMSCISANLPFPLLYLILNQEKLNLAKDGTIYLNYAVDPAEAPGAQVGGEERQLRAAETEDGVSELRPFCGAVPGSEHCRRTHGKGQPDLKDQDLLRKERGPVFRDPVLGLPDPCHHCRRPFALSYVYRGYSLASALFQQL